MSVSWSKAIIVVLIYISNTVAWTQSNHNTIRLTRNRTRTTIIVLFGAIGNVTGVTLKIAVDSNGGAADRSEIKSERFTCHESLDMVHRLRCCSDAVLVGRNTVVIDDPSLTIRRVPWKGPQPLRVIIDPQLTLLENMHEYTIFQDGHATLLAHVVEKSSIHVPIPTFVQFVRVPSVDPSNPSRMDLTALMQMLQNLYNVKHLMVEGGPQTASSFLRAGLVDRCILVRASTVTFRQSVPSGISDSILHDAGLTMLGVTACGVDHIHCWSKLPSWPAEQLGDWP